MAMHEKEKRKRSLRNLRKISLLRKILEEETLTFLSLRTTFTE